MALKLNPPIKNVFWISVVLAVLAVIGAVAPTVPVLGQFAVWIAILAYLVLVAGNTMKGV